MKDLKYCTVDINIFPYMDDNMQIFIQQTKYQ
jgi:hypothetical protein